MDTLDNTDWDVLIVGTGLQQSLLALALSRSDKKILHIDPNEYYGGAEAAFSLQEAEEWARQVNEDPTSAFSNVTIAKPETTAGTSTPSLSPSRSYSLALSPQLIYARSSLLQYLVSSKVYRQLEFLAVGAWWVYYPDNTAGSDVSQLGKLLKVPNGREDVFQDQVLDFKAKRALMKFLRFIGEYEEQADIWEEHRQKAFSAFLSEQFKVPATLQAPLLALTLSPLGSDTTTEYALPRVARHLRSIGVFGAGFGSVIPKWGGLSEVSQVGCRACAVGGGVYVLGKGLDGVKAENAETTEAGTKFRLKGGETITAKWAVGGSSPSAHDLYCRSITIVSSPLAPLFPPIAEDAPSPAAAIVVFPSGSLVLDQQDEQLPPVHITVHSSDTGECPAGQSVLYASTFFDEKDDTKGQRLLHTALDTFLSTVNVTPAPMILWSAQYGQTSSSDADALSVHDGANVFNLPPSSLDLAFDDRILDHVKIVWQKIMGEEAEDFLVFEDREAYADDDE